MSMLTPPGMGGKYRVTGAAYPRMSRKRSRTRIVLAVLGSILALALVGYGALQLIDVFRGDSPKRNTAAGAKDCPTTPPGTAAKGGPGAASTASAAAKPAVVLPPPGEITVNVYNATPRAGLAKAVGDELAKRGFVIGNVGNAPATFDKKVPGTGILLGSPTTDKAVFSVLGTQLAGTTQQTDTRETADVDLILGDAFKELSTKEDADKALALLANPVPAPKNC
ncbi:MULTISPECIES: LytR C-terminal domain-containing protein [Streptomyces]|uniref:LytR C-terminal domain-containing protein n=1 Tax=Streptomyces virginiae TaxID=1961 RepID=A0ABZ1TD61_STRVG|nr:LytR C-terminal domain-containing protein [Streptomyces virginiae]MCX4959560.1 LytR C-terminal domain-containing protein [Streptomyces virginiae]MCX5178393.1 LytR C-terminal domain-containing protein [Streptomyces virginiae]WTB23865.1 LytR C-terminal domain-containing protein [Streptomyces virginiae]